MSDTSGRLLRLLSLLQTRRDWPGPELAGRLGVTVRTVRRDVERLRLLGYPVHAELGAAGGYRLEAGTAMPPLLLDDEEAVAIALGLRGAAAGGGIEGIEETSVRALAKLEQVLPDRLRRRVNALHTAMAPISAPPAGTGVAPGTLTVIATACRDRERLRFAYRDKDEAVTRRLVEPYGLVSAGRRWYLVAWDVGRGDWRTFRVDRLEDPLPTGVRSGPREPPGGDAAAFARRSLAASRPRHQAVVLVYAPASEVAERFRVAEAELEPVDERTCRLRTAADSLEYTALRLAFLEIEFVVLEPPELAGCLRDLGRRLLRATEGVEGAGGAGAAGGAAPRD
ncbi:helix-turn-helix transcriptional regulator [Actinomadura viridis]|uniref:DNA-binding transcriptional regulator YafY n=1 Tax=Actinomadura viridis TaxID=58110 RepID=A0A931DGK0_9ACTN|nr:WYL domain-containing protein [Actinomadura viridis]MBG6089680.1 putative DNA-binding transcriptional regulator YafY [Actinomadura viridis]